MIYTNEQLRKELMNLKKVAKTNKNHSLGKHLFFSDGMAWAGISYLQAGIIAENFKGIGALPVDSLYRIVQKLDKTGETFITGSDQGVIIRTNKGDFEFSHIEECDLYECPFIQEPSKIAIREFTDIDKLQIAKKFVTKDDLRPSMQSIYLSESRMCATDAHRMYFPRVSYEFIQNGSDESKIENILIDPVVADVFKNDQSFDIYTSQKHIHYATDHKFFTHKVNDSRFPNFRAVIPTDQPNEFICNSSVLPELIDLALLAANEHTNQIDFIVNGKVEISSECLDYDRKYSAELPVKSINSSEMIFSTNGKFLSTIIKEIDNEAIFRYSAPNRAITINDEFLIMPVMRK